VSVDKTTDTAVCKLGVGDGDLPPYVRLPGVIYIDIGDGRQVEGHPVGERIRDPYLVGGIFGEAIAIQDIDELCDVEWNTATPLQVEFRLSKINDDMPAFTEQVKAYGQRFCVEKARPLLAAPAALPPALPPRREPDDNQVKP
jgi:hypothetical protein